MCKTNGQHWRSVRIPITFHERPARYILSFIDRFRGRGESHTRGTTDNLITTRGTLAKQPRIRMLRRLLDRNPDSQKELIEVTIHELAHGAGWHLDEEVAVDLGNAAAKALWELGYRRVEGPEG